MAFAESGHSPEFGDLMSLESHRTSDSVVIEIDGELDLFSAPHLSNCLTRVVSTHGKADVVLVLRGVSFIDGAGWKPVMEAGERLAGEGGRLLIVDPSRPVRRLMELIGVDEGIEVRA